MNKLLILGFVVMLAGVATLLVGLLANRSFIYAGIVFSCAATVIFANAGIKSRKP